MTGIVMAFLGAGVGVGVWMLTRALQPRPLPLNQLAAILDRQGVAVNATPNDDECLTSSQSLLANIGTAVMRSLGLTEKLALVDQLRVLDKSMERHAYEKLSLIHISEPTRPY